MTENLQTPEQTEQKLKQADIIKRSLRETFNDLNEKSLRQVSREVALAPEQRMIEVGGRKISASDLRFQVADTIENINSSDGLHQAYDLQMMMAHSIETINSETSSTQEYFRWLDDTTDILKHMNDGFVSQDDLDERNAFITMSNQREAELMVCLGLYEGSHHPQAAEKARLLRYKLQKLREMRSAIESRTRNRADVEITRAEYNMTIPYYKMFKGLAKLPFGYDMTRQQKLSLGINHDDDDDLDEEYSFFDNLRENVLEQMKEEDDLALSQEYQLAYDLSREDHPEKIQEISDKLQDLSGRRNLFRIKYAMLDNDRDNF